MDLLRVCVVVVAAAAVVIVVGAWDCHKGLQRRWPKKGAWGFSTKSAAARVPVKPERWEEK